MRRLLSLTAAACLSANAAGQLSGQVQLQINGSIADPVALQPGEGGDLNVYNPGWAPEQERPQILAVAGKDLSDQWTRYTFSFTPQSSGRVRLVLSGARPPSGTPATDAAATVYDNLRAEGAEIDNGDFERSDDHGEYTAWSARQRSVRQTTPTGDAAVVMFGNELTQEIDVAAGRRVTITFDARAAEGGSAASAETPAGAAEPGEAQTPGNDRPRRNRVAEQRAAGESYEGQYPPRWYMIDRDTPIPPAEAETEPRRDVTELLKQQISAGEKLIQLPDGLLRLTAPVTLPAGTTLMGSGNTSLQLDASAQPTQPIIALGGDDVRLANLHLTISDRVLTPRLEVGAELPLIVGQEISNVRFDHVHFAMTDRQYTMMRTSRFRPGDDSRNLPPRWPAVRLDQSSDIEVTGCNFRNFSTAFEVRHSARINFDNNRGENGLHNLLRFYHGSEYLKFNNNWVSHVKHPVVWDGGDAAYNQSLEPNEPERVDRDIKPGDPDYAGHMTGAFEVFCHNNYGEYGKTLLWGRKGRRIILTANSARYTTDLAYDAEGCEEVVFANNISINSKAGGVGVFYSNQSTVVTGNLIVTHDVGDDVYRGEFIRLHANKDLKSHNTIIANNLFVNHLSEPRFLRVDSSDRLTITGNKFVNGGIMTNPYGGGSMVIADNDFSTNLQAPGALVRVARVVEDFTFRGNTMINHAGRSSQQSAVDIAFSRGEEPGSANGTESMFRLIDGNSFRGWDTAVSFTGTPTSRTPAPIVLTNNIYDGDWEVPEVLAATVSTNNTRIPRQIAPVSTD